MPDSPDLEALIERMTKGAREFMRTGFGGPGEIGECIARALAEHGSRDEGGFRVHPITPLGARVASLLQSKEQRHAD